MLKIRLLMLMMLLCSSMAAPQEIYSKAYGNSENFPLIFIHGGPGYNSFTFEISSAQQLADRGFYVIVYDQRGGGRSSMITDNSFTFKEAVDDLLDIYQKHELETAILLGHSFGGNIGTFFTQKHPEKVQALILCGTPLSYQQTFKGIIEKCEQIYRKSSAPQLEYIETLKKMPSDSLEYSNYCFIHAISCGLYTPKTITEQAAELNQVVRNADSKGYAMHSSREPVQGFYNTEKYTTLNQAQTVKKLRKQQAVFGIYGLEDGLFDETHFQILKDSIGEENLTLVKYASHNVFIDQQEQFMNAITTIAEKVNGDNFANKVIHLYKNQLADSSGLTTEFLKAYEQHFSTDAQQKIPAIITEIDTAELEQAAFLVARQLQSLYKDFSQALPQLTLPDSILFIGDAATDGHGIRVNDNWYLFIDLNTVVTQQRHKGNMKWFLAHELAHAVHYSINDEFYRAKYTSAEDQVLKYMMAEGIATWVSMKICAIPENRAFWGDFLDDAQISAWRQYAADNKASVAQKLQQVVAKDLNHAELNRLLFYVLNLENLEQKRTGYLYGFEIISNFACETMLQQLLETPYSEMRHHILNYFSISSEK